MTTTIAMIPEQAITVYIGTTIRHLSDITSGNYSFGKWQIVMIILAGIACFAIVLFTIYLLFRATKRAIQLQKLQEEEMEMEKRNASELQSSGTEVEIVNVISPSFLEDKKDEKTAAERPGFDEEHFHHCNDLSLSNLSSGDDPISGGSSVLEGGSVLSRESIISSDTNEDDFSSSPSIE